MTVRVCVSSTKRCRGWCAFGKAYVRVRTDVHVCERVHMCICLRLLIIHAYFFQTECYALFCMIYSLMSQAAGLFL